MSKIWDALKKVKIDKDNTTIVEGAGKSAALNARIAQLRNRSKTLILTMIRKSCKKGWQSFPWRGGNHVGAATKLK